MDITFKRGYFIEHYTFDTTSMTDMPGLPQSVSFNTCLPDANLGEVEDEASSHIAYTTAVHEDGPALGLPRSSPFYPLAHHTIPDSCRLSAKMGLR